MAFTSINFFIFLIASFCSYYIAPIKIRWLVLLIASSYFYMIADPTMLAVPFCLTLVTYFAGIIIERQSVASKAATAFTLAVIIHIGSLVFFKYVNFLSDTFYDIAAFFLGPTPPVQPNHFLLQIVSPLGISYITFQSIGYLIEIKRKNHLAEKNFGHLANFILFFTKIISGPVERGHQLIPQLKTPAKFNEVDFTEGIKRIIWGLFKKLVIADRLGIYIGSILENTTNHSSISIITACVFYVFQMYADFSGYTDIAIGASRLFGFKIMENFNRPLFAKSMSEFWRKWHMSLSTWFADYFYNPIAINRRDWGTGAIVYASILTFVTLGFWHGANWTFIIFGLLHGLMLSIEFITKKQRKKMRANIPAAINNIGGMLFTFLFFGFTLIFFRAASVQEAGNILSGILHHSGPLFTADKTELAFSIIGIFFLLMAEIKKEYWDDAFSLSSNKTWQIQSVYYCMLTVLILLFGVFDGGQFIYRQF